MGDAEGAGAIGSNDATWTEAGFKGAASAPMGISARTGGRVTGSGPESTRAWSAAVAEATLSARIVSASGALGSPFDATGTGLAAWVDAGTSITSGTGTCPGRVTGGIAGSIASTSSERATIVSSSTSGGTADCRGGTISGTGPAVASNAAACPVCAVGPSTGAAIGDVRNSNVGTDLGSGPT